MRAAGSLPAAGVQSSSGLQRQRTIAAWLSLATVALIVYGSLFPFAFADAGRPGLVDAIAGLRFQPTSRGDIVSNVLLYLPLGACLLLAWPAARRWSVGIAGATVLGALLSVSIELLQAHTSSRVSSLTDVAINAFGTFAGTLAGVAYLALGTTLRVPGAVAGRAEPVPLVLVLLWLAFRLSPFVPTIDWQKYKDALKPLVFEPHVGVVETLRYLAGWLVVGYAVRRLWHRAYAPYVAAVLAGIVLAGRIVVVGKTLVPAEFVALLVAVPLAMMAARVSERHRATGLAVLVAAAILAQGLEPFEWAATARAFSWVPFASSLGSGMDWNASILIEKSFWYLALIWLITLRGVSAARAAVATAVLVGAIEGVQIWLPGRSAEITDPLLAAMVAGLLALSGTHSATNLAWQSDR